MKHHVIWMALAVSSIGCAPIELSQSTARLYQPGRAYTLAYRTELLYDNISGSARFREISSGQVTIVEQNETRSTSGEWGKIYLHVRAESSETPEHVDLLMKVSRQAGGNWYRSDDGESHEESFDTADLPQTAEPATGNLAQRVPIQSTSELAAATFRATLDERSRIAAFDASGGQFDEIKHDYSDPAEAQRAMQRSSIGIASALADSSAYLPPDQALSVGQRWRVVRQDVYPYHAYAFYMLTNGCGVASEDSTCRIENIETGPDGRVATIRISGKRIPRDPESSMPERVARMDVSGELRFNLDTHEVISLWIETKPVFITSEDARMMNIAFIDTLTARLAD